MLEKSGNFISPSGQVMFYHYINTNEMANNLTFAAKIATYYAPIATVIFSHVKIYMLFAGWEVRIVKNCDRGLENAARGRRPRAAFSSPRSQFFTIRTDPKPANNLFIFFLR